MRKVNKAFPFLLAMLIVASIALAGCGSAKDENGKGKGKSAEPTVTIFNSKVEIVDQLEALAEEYTKETGKKVEVLGAAGDQYMQQLQTKLTSNQGPSIFSASPEDAMKLKSYLYDLSNEDYVKYIAPDMELKIDDKIVGVPYGVEGFGIVYNKDMVDPKDVTDYDSFVDALKKFKGEDINGFGLSQEAYFLIGHILNTPFALQDDPLAFIEKLNKGEVKMADTKEFQDFAKFMDAIKANTKNPVEVTYDGEIGDLATGKTAMIHQGNWAYGMFEDYDLDFELGMMPFPLEGNDKLAVGVGNNWAINNQKDEAEIKAASDFLNWMLTSDTGKHYIVDEFGFIPAMTNIEAKELDPLSQAVLDASNSGETIPWAHSYFPANVVVNDLTPATQEYFLSKDMTGQQFLENLDAAWANGVK
ncbi:ABC transporter substrate-binding protein [Lederbergia sp. NSJ-179]|uniref:ABC transporter substrate-binding protein n=1 Tax=Lederbergia sp. NSJ-179 TaxID=2931402 RepID=UPI001FD5313F|nr:ABC transporter substrate-binding protein [Lederbergia sp. NSJ-179]MCJ7840043.1 ABC transporter substrate-binding protein [Lederbergia sp. NSJ-179]